MPSLHSCIIIMTKIMILFKQGFVSIQQITSKMNVDMKNCLLLAHAISGYDTVSATFGIGKLKAYRKLNQSPSWQNIMQIVGKCDVDLDKLLVRERNL